MENLGTYLVDACIILGGLNGLASAILLCIPQTSTVYPIVSTVATDLKMIWNLLSSIVGPKGAK